MKKIYCFLYNNESDSAVNSDDKGTLIHIAFENPLIVAPYLKAIENYCKRKNVLSFCLYSGSAAEIINAVQDGRVEIGIVFANSNYAKLPECGNIDILCKPDKTASETFELPVKFLSDSFRISVIWDRNRTCKCRDNLIMAIQDLALK